MSDLRPESMPRGSPALQVSNSDQLFVPVALMMVLETSTSSLFQVL